MHSLAVRLLRTSATSGVKHGNIFRNLSCLQTCSSSYVATNKFLNSGLRNAQNNSLHSDLRREQQKILLSQSRLFSNTTALHSQDPDKDQPKEGIVKRFKKMAKDYWYVLIPVHVATSIVWFGGFYVLAKSGVDIISVLEALHIPRSYTEKLEGSDAGYYAIAYACYKVATPARYTVTVGGTTYSIVKLTERGFIKKSSEISDSIKDKREDLKEKYQEKYDGVKEKYQEKYDGVKEKYDGVKEKYDGVKEKYQEKYDGVKEKYKDGIDNAREKFSKTKSK
eukprot:TRINITY_DN4965_c0_g1_i1.p1 TRINITY_DN4965_c0_g1~~TRINITY_DN4965_c0_g1_i1.p1  ORF type:complete len:280 (-),score=41.78 TRINITY_DN4965_c0_g1_i1:162-1001(-)